MREDQVKSETPEVVELTLEIAKLIDLGTENTNLWEYHGTFTDYHYIIAKLACSYITDPAGTLKDHGIVSEDDINNLALLNEHLHRCYLIHQSAKVQAKAEE